MYIRLSLGAQAYMAYMHNYRKHFNDRFVDILVAKYDYTFIDYTQSQLSICYKGCMQCKE